MKFNGSMIKKVLDFDGDQMTTLVSIGVVLTAVPVFGFV